jgi:putative membrane protein
MISWYGAGDIVSALVMCGPGLVLVAASHLLPVLLDSIGWRYLLRSGHVPSLISLMRLRWIGESINSLLPAVQIGGDIVRASLARRDGVDGAVAGASIVVEITIALITQVLFTFFGVGILLFSGEDSMAFKAVAGTAAMSALTGAFVFMQRKGLLGNMVQLLSKIGGDGIVSAFAHGASRLDEEIRTLYREHGRLTISGCWRLAGWMAGAVEVWLALYFMGHGISMGEAVMLESLGQAVRAAAFMVPGALGIQEGGFVILCSVIGITPDIAIGLSLAKRVRELVLGIPGLVAWQAIEGRRLFTRN